MKRQICLALSILFILLAYTVPAFGDRSEKEDINFFDAVYQNGKVSVNWQISGQYETPTRIDYYAVERKQAAGSYMVIGGLNEKDESSGLREFSFEDSNVPSQSFIQYRLKIVYKDGTEAYSRIKNIYLKDIIEPELTPNPFNESISVSMDHQTRSPYQIRIYNIKGQEVFNSGLIADREDFIRFELNTSDLQPGVYIFSMKSGADNWQKKIFKQ